MKCKHCGEEIQGVIVISQCFQQAEIDGNGRITSLEPIENPKVTGILCPHCDGDLTAVITGY